MKFLESYGSQLITWRVLAVPTTGTALTIPSWIPDVKWVTVHREGSTVVGTLRGTVAATRMNCAALAVVDATGGKVDIPCTGHGFAVGSTVKVVGTVNYDGSYTVLSGTTTDLVRITKTYVAETVAATMYVEGFWDAILTSDGWDFDLPVGGFGGFPLCTLISTSGTQNFSIIAGR